MKQIIMVCGFPGVGKTTFCKDLEKQTGAYFFNADEFYQENSSLSKSEYIAAKADKARSLLNQHDTIIIDGVFHRKEDRQAFTKIAQSRIISLTCPEDIVKQRIETQDHIIDKEERWQTYLRAKANWEEIQSHHETMDTSIPT